MPAMSVCAPLFFPSPSPPPSPSPSEEFSNSVLLMVPAGSDIVSAIIDYARNEDASIVVHHASGEISEIELCDPVDDDPDDDDDDDDDYDDYVDGRSIHMVGFTGFYSPSLSPNQIVPFSVFNVEFFKGTRFVGVIGGRIRQAIATEPVYVTATLLNKNDYYQEQEVMVGNINIEPVIKSTGTYYDDIFAFMMTNAINEIITVNHPSGGGGGGGGGGTSSSSSYSQINAQLSFSAPTDWNVDNPTNQADN